MLRISATLFLSVFTAIAAVTPTQILQSAAAYQGLSDKELSTINAYSLAMIAGIGTSPSLALSNAAAFQGLDSRSLAVITAYASAQMQAGGGIGGGTFGTNWVSAPNQTSRSITNFTDMQFLGGATYGALADNTILLGGSSNRVSGTYAFIGGGITNQATNFMATIVNGGWARAWGQFAFIGNSYFTSGGSIGNTASGTLATCVNGEDCIARGTVSFIGNGNDAHALQLHSTVVNGSQLINNAPYAIIGGGQFNTIGDDLDDPNNPIDPGALYSAIFGGVNNTIKQISTNSFIGAGSNNTVYGNYSSILAGKDNNVGGSNSMAIGSELVNYTNNLIVVGIGTHQLAIGTTGITNSDPFYTPNGQQVVGFWSGNTGNQAIPAATSAFYAANGNSSTNIAVTDVSGFTRNVVTRTVTLGNLYVVRQTAGGVGHTTTVTIFTNGVASNIQASLNNSQTGNDTADTVTILAGTEVGIKIITPASDTPSNHSWSFEAR